MDTIREEEKYGNTGDKFYGTGRSIVGGAEGISNLVNSLIAVRFINRKFVLFILVTLKKVISKLLRFIFTMALKNRRTT